MVLFWLSVRACGQKLNEEHAKWNNTNKNLPKRSTVDQDQLLSSRSYGFKEPNYDYLGEVKSEVSSNYQMPATSSSKLVEQTFQYPDTDYYGEPYKSEQQNYSGKVDSFERLNEPVIENDDSGFQHVKKLKEVSIFSKERNKALDPVSDQQGYAQRKIVRPLRDISLVIRNRHYPVYISRHYAPYPWIPLGHHHHKHHRRPLLPNHKPCKPCKPKVHKKHHGKPKKPKKKHKKHCHKKPKKPHHKKLIYYAPKPAAMNYYYGSSMPSDVIEPNADEYATEESLENDDVETETRKPFHKEVEEDVEEHRLAEMSEPYDEDDPVDRTIKAFDKQLV